MYDWIPMEFDFRFCSRTGEWRDYYVIANSKNREFFTIYLMPGLQVGNTAYPLSTLLKRLQECNGTINGMTMDELQCESMIEEHEIDILSLI